jgi:hypothetical protein
MDPDPPDPQIAPHPELGRNRNLTGDERRQLISRLLTVGQSDAQGIKFPRGTITAVAAEFHVSTDTLRRVWARAQANYADPTVRQYQGSPKRKGRCGRKKKWDPEAIREAILDIPLYRRRSIRDLAAALGIPKSTLFDLKNDDDNPVIIPHNSALRPLLSEHHKLMRTLFCIEKLNPVDNQYDDFYQSVHVDEKWFFITESHLRLYLVPGEAKPDRRVQNKDHILKVMFLGAVARPMYNNDGDCIFDGKIGMFPFIERVAAQRSSALRPRGTIITKPLSVNKERYRDFLVNKVVPAIKAKWAGRANRNITIQQDGASAHIDEDDAAFVAAGTDGLWNIQLETQPAKSPDFNVLDLSFFRALQSHQWRSGFANNVDELVAQVLLAFDTFEPRKLDFAFLTLQYCLDDALSIHGDNNYSIQHIGKESMLAAGTLPVRVPASEHALEVRNLMEQQNEGDADTDDSDAEDVGVVGNVDNAAMQMIQQPNMEAV